MTREGQIQKPWTEDEKNAIRELYPYVGRTAIGGYRQKLMARCSGRSWIAIRHVAASLGIFASGRKTLSLSESESGYLAGITDGEASISMNRSFKMKRDGNKFYWTPCITYTNTSVVLMDWLDNIFSRAGLQFYRGKKYGIQDWQKPCYRIQVGGSPSVTAILEAVVDHLRVKKEQAQILMEFTSSRIGMNQLGLLYHRPREDSYGT
jgi:hypothetical protein